MNNGIVSSNKLGVINLSSLTGVNSIRRSGRSRHGSRAIVHDSYLAKIICLCRVWPR